MNTNEGDNFTTGLLSDQRNGNQSGGAEGLVKGTTPRVRELDLAWMLGSGFEPWHLKKKKRKEKAMCLSVLTMFLQ